MRTVVDCEMVLERDQGEVDVVVEGYVVYSVDTTFGSDADGNRGERKVSVEDVQATDEDGDDVDLTEEELGEAKEKLGDKFLERGY